MPSLVLKNVSKRFGGLLAVNDVNMEVPPGRITGLIGPNGAGKTTVVNMITGLLKLSTGSIKLDDADISEAEAHEVAFAGVSRTFQNIRLLPEATVLENVLIGFHVHVKSSLFAQLVGLPSSTRETPQLVERAKKLLDRFGMSRYADHPAGGLAYGHQRRVEMMRAVATEPKILLLDEPVAGMNDVEATELGKVFQELAASGIGLLLIEHNIRFVNQLCQQVYVLDSGNMIASGTPQEVMHNPAVIAAYLGNKK
jgi:branched-chain amino acid transport system ATP-binding protein